MVITGKRDSSSSEEALDTSDEIDRINMGGLSLLPGVGGNQDNVRDFIIENPIVEQSARNAQQQR